MFIWTGAQGRAQAAAGGEATPLLHHLAGRFAHRIAGLWPAPHNDFIGAPADRRHLICLALSRIEGQLDPELAEALLALPLKRAARLALPEAPEGLARALSHIGEVAWEGEDYERLAMLVGAPGTAQAIRHARQIEPQRLRVLASLPAPLREAGFASKGLTHAQARLVGEVWAALVARDGEVETLRRARAWSAVGSLNERFERIRADLTPQFPAPPFPGSERLKPLPTRAALLDAAGRYRNCLGNYVASGGAGDSAFYEWTGEPGAVLQISRDPLFGWVLAQARARDNAEVPQGPRQRIIAELRSWGVHVGRSHWALDNALARAQARGFNLPDEDEAIEDLFCD